MSKSFAWEGGRKGGFATWWQKAKAPLSRAFELLQNRLTGASVRSNGTTNTLEGFFCIMKRGINGVYHHVGKKHLHRYVSEYEFRYNARKVDDGDRTELAIAGCEGKRLKYRD